MAKKAKRAKKAKTAKRATKARKSAKTAKRGSQKRQTLKRGRKNVAFAKRRSDGTFKEIDDTGRSSSQDRRRKAKRKVKSGFGDRGDQ